MAYKPALNDKQQSPMKEMNRGFLKIFAVNLSTSVSDSSSKTSFCARRGS